MIHLIDKYLKQFELFRIIIYLHSLINTLDANTLNIQYSIVV